MKNGDHGARRECQLGFRQGFRVLMDTPDAASRAPESPPLQESPFFNYVNSLSPIKHVTARSISHDIIVPSPQAVFTSPHMNFPRNMSLIMRSQKETLSGPENFSPGFVGNTVAQEENIDIYHISASIPGFQLDSKNDDSFQEHSSSCHTGCVAEFLADHDGDSDNPSMSSGSHPRKAATSLGILVECTNMNAEANVAKIDGNDKVQNCTCSGFDGILPTDIKGDISNELPYLLVKSITDISQGFEGHPTVMKEASMKYHVLKPVKSEDSNMIIDFDSSFQDENNITGKETHSSMDIPLSEGDNRSAEIDLESTEESYYQMHESSLYSVHGCIGAGLPSSQTSQAQYKQMAIDQVAGSCLSFLSGDGNLLSHANDAFDLISEGVKGLPDENYVQQEPFSDEEMKKIPCEDAGIVPGTSNENPVLNEHLKGVQHHVMRKRLEFGAAETCILKNGEDKNSCDYKITSNDDEKPLGCPLESGNSHSIYADTVAKPIDVQASGLVNITGNTSTSNSEYNLRTPDESPDDVNPPSKINQISLNTVLRPCGIGLHLNSIGNAASMRCTTKAHVSAKELTIKGKDTVHGSKISLPKGNFTSCTSINVRHLGKFVATSVEPLPLCTAENKDKLSNSSTSPQTVIDVKQLNTSDSIDGYVTPRCLKSPQGSSRLEESSQTSPRKKRKKSIDGGCKHCNCRKSKCLKLYCDCFASGNFCTEDCACRECFNKPEHENVVSETRRQIELRNPLAFAPRVVRGVDSHKDNGYSEHITPVSARHKTGCNCKKSLCLKKYCECFQAGVGCSLGCRCEGCQNTFGRNDGFQGIGELDRKVLQEDDDPKNFVEEKLNSASSHGKIERRQSRDETTSFNHSRLSPLTPSLQGSSENDVSKLLLPASYYPSPESSVPVLNSFSESLSPSKVLLSCDNSEEGRAESLSIILHDHKQDCNVAKGVGTILPCQDGFPDISTLSPLSSLSSFVSGNSSSHKGEQKVLQSKLFQVNSCLSSNNPRWHNSPITPFPHFGDGKLVIAPDSDTGQSDNVYDGTPDILKDTSPLITEVKTTSPNKKRVSPPHKHFEEARPSISPSIKSRKYILHSVPSFPSLTPYRKAIDDDDT